MQYGRIANTSPHAPQGSLCVEVGDWVKLAPATGETQDTIGQLQVPSSPHLPPQCTLSCRS